MNRPFENVVVEDRRIVAADKYRVSKAQTQTQDEYMKTVALTLVQLFVQAECVLRDRKMIPSVTEP